MIWNDQRPLRCCCPGFDEPCHDGSPAACGQPAEWFIPVPDLPDRLPFCTDCAFRAGAAGCTDEARWSDSQEIARLGMPPNPFPPAWHIEKNL